jgi:L-threonylcarbamoyladenylate synthase
MMPSDRIDLSGLVQAGAGAAALATVARRIREGAVFVYPTETIYGIGGIMVPEVRDRIYAVKHRPSGNQLIAIAGSRQAFSRLPLVFSPAAEKIAATFWPGNCTLVVPLAESQATLAVRVSSHPFLVALAGHLDEPIYSTSANRSAEEYKNDPDVIFRLFDGSIDFMIDAGPLPTALPSTIVAVGKDDTVTVLREGVISRAEIQAVCRQNNVQPTYARDTSI